MNTTGRLSLQDYGTINQFQSTNRSQFIGRLHDPQASSTVWNSSIVRNEELGSAASRGDRDERTIKIEAISAEDQEARCENVKPAIDSINTSFMTRRERPKGNSTERLVWVQGSDHHLIKDMMFQTQPRFNTLNRRNGDDLVAQNEDELPACNTTSDIYPLQYQDQKKKSTSTTARIWSSVNYRNLRTGGKTIDQSINMSQTGGAISTKYNNTKFQNKAAERESKTFDRVISYDTSSLIDGKPVGKKANKGI